MEASVELLVARPPSRRPRHRWVVAALFLLVVMGVNAIAFVQAWSMTHYAVGGGMQTAAPEYLSTGGKLWVMLTGVRYPRSVNLQTPDDFHLPFQARHVSSDQFDLETWSIPAAPAAANPRGLVLMYHGYKASKASLLSAAQKFHELGYDVELIDFRGSGGSTGNATTIGYREADDVAATVLDARQNLLAKNEPTILFGESMGAAAILRAVGDLGVTTDAIIIESPFNRLLSTAVNRFHAMHLPGFPLAQILVFWGGIQQGYWGFNLNPAESATRVHCPTLMFHGQLDTRVTAEQANEVFDHLAGPKHLEWYAQAGHTAFLSSDPQRWTGSVSSFLERYLK